jgi:hypothetical protein
LAHLCPPNQRTKARYLNVNRLVNWGQSLLTVIEQAKESRVEIKEKLGWVLDYREQLEGWKELIEVVTTVENFVRKQGITPNISRELSIKLEKQLPIPKHHRTIRVQNILLDFVKEQESYCEPGERLLGSSEIIESVFGKQKRLEQDQAKSGFTGLLLGIAAMVSTTTSEVIKKALETVPTLAVLDWCKENIGQSVQAKRIEVQSLAKTE